MTSPAECAQCLAGAERATAAAGIASVDFVPGKEGVFTLPGFTFESGERLDNLRVGYVVHGVLNAARDNAVLVLPGTANTRHSADGYIGPGRALDTERLCVIAADAIGAGTSSAPQDGLGGAFPRYSVRDMMRAAHRLVAEHFGVTRLKAVFGASMGAFQALESVIHHPAAIERAVLLVPAVRAGVVFKGAVQAMIEVIGLDAAWKDGTYTEQPLAGLRAAGRLYFPWTVSDAYLETLGPQQFEHDLGKTVERAAAWDAWTLIRRYQASASHDIGTPFGGDIAAALAGVTASVLVMPTTTDRLLGVESARLIARHVPRATYVEIPSERGHLGWRAMPNAPETRLITEQVTRFLS
jgi:homoserine O-acetyltransferase/O-succinyltransferase